jgi:hypothetical protein
MANAIKINKGSALLAGGEAGADVAWSMEAITSGAGRVSAQYDLGVLPRGAQIEWSCEVQFQATPTQYKGLELYVAGAPDHDSTQIDGDIGATDAALGDVDMRKNLLGIGYVVSENAAASEPCVRSGRFDWTMRYISFVGYNDSGATINATDSNFRFDFRVVYDEIQ